MIANIFGMSTIVIIFTIIVNVYIFHFDLLILFLLLIFMISAVDSIIYLATNSAPKISMMMNDNGITIDKNGYKRVYLWPDIADVKIYSEQADIGAPVVSFGIAKHTYIDYMDIWRKGELVHDIKAYCPRADFDIGANDLESLIRDGMSRWGNGDHSVN